MHDVVRRVMPTQALTSALGSNVSRQTEDRQVGCDGLIDVKLGFLKPEHISEEQVSKTHSPTIPK